MNRPTDNQQQPHASIAEQMRQSANVVALASGVFATFAEVALFRTTFGERFFHGWKTGLVIPLIVLFPLFWPQHDPTPVLLCLPLYLAMCACHRLSIYRRRRRGDSAIHSHYNGACRLLRTWPRVGEETLKRKYEPAVMLCFGFAAFVFSPPLGWFFLCCAAGMAVHAGLLHADRRARSLDLADARIDGQLAMAAVRPSARTAANRPDSFVTVHGGGA
ncbi:MAG: hypothetical protein AB7G17_01125 [Phycisphaerales bacterium]